MLTPEERATQTLSSNGPTLQHLSPPEMAELTQSIAQAIRDAVAADRKGLLETLRLCTAAFDEALSLKDLPHPFRAVVRVCKTLCLEALGEGEEKGKSGGEALANRRTPEPQQSPS